MTVKIFCNKARGTIRTIDQDVKLIEVQCDEPLEMVDLAMVLREAIMLVLGVVPDVAEAQAAYQYLKEVFGKMDEVQEMTVDELLTVNMELEAIERERDGLPPAYVEMEA